MSVPGGFPARPDMPVISAKKGHLSLAIKLLKSGAVDLNPPYADEKAGAGGPEPDDKATQTSESHSSNGEVISERWEKLAGLIK